MNAAIIFAIATIGFSAGLRAFTAPAVVSWFAHLGWINLSSTPLDILSSLGAVVILTLMAVGEYAFDLLPNAPNRTATPALIARIITGSLTAACLLSATGQDLRFFIVGGVAAICGAFVGFHLRVKLVRALSVADPFVAVAEDVISIALAVIAISVFLP